MPKTNNDLISAIQDITNSENKLNIENWGLGQNETKVLKNLTEKNAYVEVLILSGNQLPYPQTFIPEIFFKHMTTLVVLNLSNTGLTDVNAHKLVDVISKNYNVLEELNLSNNHIKKSAAGNLGNMLKQANTQLKKLDISNNLIGDLGAQAIQDGLKHFNNKVIHVNFSNTGMKQGGANAIADALKQPDNKVKYIDFGSNQIQKSMGSIADALKQPHNKVKEIDLSNCRFSDHDLEIISDALKQPDNKVEVIDLSNNNFTNTTYNEEYDCYPVDGLVGALRETNNLREINLSGNKFDNNVFKKIKNSVCSFETVKLIVLRGNPISYDEKILEELKELKKDHEVDILIDKIEKKPETITKTPQPTQEKDSNPSFTQNPPDANQAESSNTYNHSYFNDDYAAKLMGDNTGYPTVPVDPDTIELCD